MNLEEKGQKIIERIDHIRKTRAEQDKLLAELERQASLMVQGIDPEQIARFVYEPSLDDRKKSRKHWLNPLADIYNVVYLKDGSRVQLKEPILQ